MLRFTTRDILWMTIVVAMALAWGKDRWGQSARIRAVEAIAGIEAIELFPRDWEGIAAGFRNEQALLRFRVEALSHELEQRGHHVEIDGCNVFVDRPYSQLLLGTTKKASGGQFRMQELRDR